MKRISSLLLAFLLVCSTLSVLTNMPNVSAAVNQYFIYSKFDPPSIDDITGVGGYVEYYGVPEYGDEIQYVYFLSGYTGYKMKVWTTDGDGDGKIEPRQHPNHYLAGFVGPIEPRHFQIVSSAYLDGRTYGSSGHTEEFYVDSSGVYLGAYPYGINKWDHNWNYVGKIANSAPTRTESMAYNPSENTWYAGGRTRTIYQLRDTDNDGSFLDESWRAIFTHPSYGGDHHDGMEYVGGYLWISDMTSDVIGKWQFNTATDTWQELARFTYTEPASVEGMGFGPNDHFWVGSGWGSGSYIYELGNEITKGYPIADAGDDVDNHPPIIPVQFDASESHHTDPTKNIVSYEWDFESDGKWDYSLGRFVYPTGLLPTAPDGKRSYGYDGACTYYSSAGWLARGDKGHYGEGWYHIGQDIEANVGDNVYSIAAGDIVYVSYGGWGDGNCGLFLEHSLSDGGKFWALYAHLDISSIKHKLPETSGWVEPSIPIGAGEAFAKIGWHITGPHLHFGIHEDPNPPSYIPDQKGFGMMNYATYWPDANVYPSDTNGFVDPMEWIAAHTPFISASLQVKHSYLAFYNPDGSIDWSKTAKDYTASLRVTDDSDPALRDTDTRIVHITAPPWKPVADPNGPYTGYEKVPVKLDGSKSYDPESKMFPTDHPWYETIAKYDWDLDNDGEFDDATGSNPTYTWNTAGTYTIRLKVTDSQPSGPGGSFGDLDVDKKYATVIVKKPVFNLCVVFTEFSDNDPAPSRPIADFQGIKNDLISYYNEISYGSVSFDVKFYPDDGSWLSLPHDRKYYGENTEHKWWLGNLNKLYPDKNSEQFVYDGISASDSALDFTKYDYDAANGKGMVLFVHPGYSEQHCKSTDDLKTAAHVGDSASGYLPTNDNTNIDAIVLAEKDNLGGWAHEVGHILGKLLVTSISGQSKDGMWALPDRYSGAGNGDIDDWGLMGDGSWLPDHTGTHPDHMCSFSKEWLGWLKYQEYQPPSYGTYWIESLETLKYSDNVFRYKINDNLYYILEVRNKNSRYSNWDTTAPTPWLFDSAEVIYKVERKSNKWIVNVASNIILFPFRDSYSDDANNVLFKVIDENWGTRYEMKTEIKKPTFWNKLGMALDPNAQLLSSITKTIQGTGFQFAYPLPDLDLHAYSDDGKHVGMNYVTGEYEIQIPGATASGDLWNGQEWIFVPDNIKVHFVVSSRDNAEFLNAFPEALEFTNGLEAYKIRLIYYDPNGIRYESSPVSGEIMPGEENIHRFVIIQNPDGTYTPVIDDVPPSLTVETPQPNDALQDGVTLKAHAWDENGVSSVTFSIREPNGEHGTPISPSYEYMPAYLSTDDRWIHSFDTTLLPDGYYVAYVEATDIAGNKANETVNFSIRNWAPIELLPASEKNNAGRTMPVKFSIRVIASVDPTQPFIRNEELTIMIYRKGYPGTILQTSTYGTTSKDYRIDPVSEKYITNFKTLSTSATYVVEIYRKGMLIGSFQFYTVINKMHEYIAAE